MKSLWIVLALFATQLPALAGTTAYQALRVISKQRGATILSHVIEVNGSHGTPQPTIWKVLLDDPSARGGVRELDVQNGQIVAEKTPLRQFAGVGNNVTMNFQKLNLDSTGVFTVANREARASYIAFDMVAYHLRSNDERGTPVWTLRLLTNDGRNVGTLTISADSGQVLQREGFASKATQNHASATPQTTYPDQTITTEPAIHDVPNNEQPQRNDDDEENSGGIKHQIKQKFYDAGETIYRFFSGRGRSDY